MTHADSRAIILRRTLSGTRERVFAAWTRPELMTQWFFPAQGWVARVSADLRIGGRYQVEMRDEAGGTHVQHGRYQVIEPVSRLVFTWSCPDLGVEDSVVTLELEARGKKTELILTHQLPADPKVRREHEEGWTGCLGQLERFLGAHPKEENAVQSIKDSIRIQSSFSKAVDALTREAGYRGWWSKDCKVPEKPGEEAALRFNKNGNIVSMRFRIDSLDAKAGNVVWTCVGHDHPAWVGTSLRWRVIPAADRVEVQLEHAGWRNSPPEPVVQGWSFFLKSLKAYLETGAGEPW